MGKTNKKNRKKPEKKRKYRIDDNQVRTHSPALYQCNDNDRSQDENETFTSEPQENESDGPNPSPRWSKGTPIRETTKLLGFLIPGLNLVGSYLSQPNQLDQSNQTILTSPRSLLVTWKLKSQPSHLGQINHSQVNKHRPHPRKIRILAILVRTNSNTQDIEPYSLARINYNIDDDQ